MGPQGQPLTKLFECGPTADGKAFCSSGPATANGLWISKDTTAPWDQIVLGKVWLLPYQTGGNWSGLQTGYMWFDELIISRNDIADPVDGGGNAQPPAAPTGLTLK